MSPCEFFWVLICYYGSIKVFIGANVSLWVLMGAYVALWVFISLYRS